MPQVKNAPKGLNDLLEDVYGKCIKSGKSKSVCSASAWSAAHGAGWYKGDDGKWHKRMKLKKQWIKKLITMPESGMGFQKVDLYLKDGRTIKNLLVYNSEIIELSEGHENVILDDIKEVERSFDEGTSLIEKREKAFTQSILLSKKRFKTKKEAVAWLKGHKKKYGDIDETEENWRARQRDPGDFRRETFRVHEITSGVKLIIGRLKK